MLNNVLLCVSPPFVLCRVLQGTAWEITHSQAFGFKEEGQEGDWQDGLAVGRE